MIAIVDCSIGNIGSVLNACRHLGVPAEVVDNARGLSHYSAVVLPGVGAFGDAMKGLTERGFDSALKEWLAARKPFLGICLGLQILFEESEESPGVRGLGIFPGCVKRFPPSPELKVPQMGWNRVYVRDTNLYLFRGIPNGSYFYFVHSYYVPKQDEETEAAYTDYGIRYVSAIAKDNLAAVQFHPEKSQKVGLQLLRNFFETIQYQEGG